MAQKIINIGTVANDSTGDTLRGAFSNTNNNFTELYNNDANLTSNIVSLTVAANNWANTVGDAGNNYANQVGAAANNWANTVGDAGNNYMITIVTDVNSNAVNNAVGANAWSNTLSDVSRAIANNAANSSNNYAVSVGVSSNIWTNTVGVIANSYANTVGNAGNNYTITIVTGVNSNVVNNAVGANNWANTKLANINRPINAVGAGNYVLLSTDAGKTIVADSTIFVPNAVFSSGNVIFIYNNTATAITITPNSDVTIFSAANSFGFRTLSANGYATLACIFGLDVGQNVFSLMGTNVT